MRAVRAQPPPPCWHAFWAWLEMPAPLQARLWRAVRASTSPTVQAWYYALLYYQPKPQAAEYTQGFIFGTLSPQRVIETVEVLRATGALTRREANQVEEFVLTWANAEGRWA